MRKMTFRISGVVLVALGLTLSPSWPQEAQKSPEKTTLEVTYYYLPG